MHGVGKWHFVQASITNNLVVMNQRLLTISKMLDMDYTIFLDSVYFHERLLLQNYE